LIGKDANKSPKDATESEVSLENLSDNCGLLLVDD
jgi:hypothetical protein